MIQCVRLILADDAVAEKDTGAVSLFTILDEVQLSHLPGSLYRIAIYYLLTRSLSDSNSPEVEIRASANDKNLPTHKVPVDFQDKLRFNGVIRAFGIPLEEEGILEFTLAANGTALLSAQISVKLGSTIIG